MHYDTTIAKNLQERYYREGAKYLTLLYLELRRMAALILHSMGSQRIDEFSHEAATAIIERYLSKPTYRIKSFYDVVNRACLDAKGERFLNPSAGHPERPKSKAHTSWIDLDQVRIAFNVNENVADDDPIVLSGLANYFRHFDWFRPAIKGLMPYLPKRWMLDNAQMLKRVFLEVRNGRRSQGAAQRPSKVKSETRGPGDNNKIQESSRSTSKPFRASR